MVDRLLEGVSLVMYGGATFYAYANGRAWWWLGGGILFTIHLTLHYLANEQDQKGIDNMNSNKRDWKPVDKTLSIKWGKLSSDDPVSLSDRQREDDRLRALPFRTVYIEVTDGNEPTPCVFCSDPITEANRGHEHDGHCVLCEIEVNE